MQDVNTNLTATPLVDGAPNKAATDPTPVSLPQLIEALAILNIKVVSPENELKTEEGTSQASAANGIKISPAGKVPASPATDLAAVINGNIRTATDLAAVINGNIRTRPPPVGPVAISPNISGTIATIKMTPSVIKTADLDDNSAATSASAGNTGEEDKPSGYVCNHCHQHNVVRSSKETVYLVTVGRSVGVFTGWHNVQPLVSGVAHACYKKYSSQAAAVDAFKEALAAGTVVVV